jgi:hypothetical protein
LGPSVTLETFEVAYGPFGIRVSSKRRVLPLGTLLEMVKVELIAAVSQADK